MYVLHIHILTLFETVLHYPFIHMVSTLLELLSHYLFAYFVLFDSILIVYRWGHRLHINVK